ncbi:[FeFe] hydrogenase H-cluster radical SAM maturase HydE [Ferrimonas pelagia]|uniref:[FeFe] hydrogenase H-cluster radical SAM maturase HydE n=1 Tax=Ferrimonas pelagia TaxID=1177826 RepID=A0ABP9EIQ1_9GAMM
MTLSLNPPLSLDRIQAYLGGEDDERLFAAANAATLAQFGDTVFLRGIIEFSNHCRNNCHYCGLRSGNREVLRYRLEPDHILACAQTIADAGIGTVVLQSGDDWRYRADTIAELITTIKARHDVAITLSLGDRKPEELRLWREAGADRYLLKMETFDRELFAQVRPDSDFQQRLDNLQCLKALGYQVGCGVITGLPGMTDAILAQDLLTLTELELDMLACGPYVMHPQTPMAGLPDGDVLQSLRVTALLRLMNPGALIPATSALNALLPSARDRALQCGANVVMPSFTPQPVFASYQIYPGKNDTEALIDQRLTHLTEELSAIARRPGHCRGDTRRSHHVHR